MTTVYPSGYAQPAPSYVAQPTYTAPSNSGTDIYDSYWFWILLFLAIVALVLAIIAIVWIGTREEGFELLLAVQDSSATATSDSFQTDIYDMYINHSSVALSLNISASVRNQRGRQLYIKNDGPADVILDTGSLNDFNEGRIPNGTTIETGVNAEFIFVENNNLLRLQ